jgi:hypothetical protein
MIWGETNTEHCIRVLNPSNWYAWRPVRLDSGQWVWFETVLRYKKHVPLIGYSPLWYYKLR